ncbi:MAG: ATP-dependent helicase [Propionibacteriaceae bacterium]|jgi:DNA helicase-2/ATP-dependent DNA helicase PcrA|nr:ATP-dependent helicase [Propionibacteriaceae bacterium]
MDDRQLLQDLDDQQRLVVEAVGSPVACLAGAGSGKTRTLTYRLAHAALTGAIDPRAALCVTFTTTAAAEIKQRLTALGVTGVSSRTFHAASLRQAQYFWPQVYGSQLPPIVERRDELIERVCVWLGWQPSAGLVSEISTELSWIKQSNVLPEQYVALAETSGRHRLRLEADQMADAIVAYEEIKQAAAVIDMDDLLLCNVALLSTSDATRRQVQQTYRHFAFDEYQDVSPLQARLVELWVGRRDDVLVVGDPDQAIHSFAGSRSSYLQGFAATHPGTIEVSLTNNYRSSSQIVAAARIVGHPTRSMVAAGPVGSAVQLIDAADDQAEQTQVVAWLQAGHQTGRSWSDMAILVRTHSQVGQLRQVLQTAGVPFSSRDDLEWSGRDRLHLGTIHAAKGDEWSQVALMGLDENHMPFSLAKSPDQVAEERRLLYVGMTRARQALCLSWSRTADGLRVKPSPFLDDLVAH